MLTSSCLLYLTLTTQVVHATSIRNPFISLKSKHSSSSSKYYQIDDDERSQNNEKSQLFVGSGREFNLFDNRGGADASSSSSPSSPSSTSASQQWSYAPKRNNYYRKKSNTKSIYKFRSEYNKSNPSSSAPSNNTYSKKSVLSSFKEWISNGNLPKLQCRVEPNTTLKVRKTFRPLKTIIRLGADFNTQLGVWQFKSSWEDAMIGGKLTLAGREVQFSKTWLLSVGAVEDLVTRLRLRAAVDLGTMKAYARLGFRTERLSPINVVEGFTMVKQLPLDGNYGHVKLEVKANFAFPEPEIEYSTENHRSFVGMGDIEINIDELNLLLDY